MGEWWEEECRPFDLYETEDGLYYQAVGTEDNREKIEGSEIIKKNDTTKSTKCPHMNKVNTFQRYL